MQRSFSFDDGQEPYFNGGRRTPPQQEREYQSPPTIDSKLNVATVEIEKPSRYKAMDSRQTQEQ
jgi:hypothetical protein